MAERQPSKLNVAGSIPVSRSTPTVEQRRRRLAIARAASGIELAIATLAVGLVVFIAIAAPKYSGPQPDTALLFALAVAGALAGYVWMLRIRFANPEAGDSPWRHREPPD